VEKNGWPESWKTLAKWTQQVLGKDENIRPEVGMGIFLLAPKLLLLPEPIMNLAPRMALWRNLGCLG